ncbi:rhamnan synthesis F family protein [Paracoccus sp. (in: a-proteobacteria)]|uniref:rhamnan synthesis F family protein n=1 Tax=Paracoccus sp. TaxID=267 RepID=UPI0028A6277E|nr:rhamnan synthesis F family protein [Paracoccus sp. (in: a-proteobacteria)]
MTTQVDASLKDISNGAKWRGHFDGLGVGGTLHGWAFLAVDPYVSLELDLYIRDVHLASTVTTVNRPDIDRILGIMTPAKTGFSFDLKTFRPEGALELLRKLGRLLPKANLRDDLRICIAGTQHRLPGSASHAGASLDLTPLSPHLVRAAAAQLRNGIAAGEDVAQLSVMDHQILLLANPLFCADWYNETYGEVRFSNLDPVEHYARLSSVLDRPPGPWFDTAGYLATLPAGQELNLPPVVHYDIHGHDCWWPGKDRFRTKSPCDRAHGDYAVLIHLYHLDTIPDLQRLLASFSQDVDIFISIPEDSSDHDPDAIASLFPRVREILRVPNRGQDVGAFMETVRRLKGRGYRFFCKVHSKKGNKYPETWRRVMFDALAATPERVAQTVELFRANPKVLMAGPAQFWLNGAEFQLGSGPRLEEFAGRIGLGSGALSQEWGFFAGTCFWIDAELAALIAEAVTADDFSEVKVARDGQTAHAIERLFSLVGTSVGGQIALLDGCDWSAPPVIPEDDACLGLKKLPSEDVAQFLVRHLRALTAPRIVEGTALKPHREEYPDDIFGGVDAALHGAIDVVITCWMGQYEPMHQGLARLHHHLSENGITSAVVLSGTAPMEALQSLSCANLFRDHPMMDLPAHLSENPQTPPCESLSPKIAHELLRSECVFKGISVPTGDDIEVALKKINDTWAYWRAALIRHKVKMFLIWGNTAPKSRLFIHLCQDLGIEYQIIERGHFPRTLSIDPMGQFGTGVHPRLVTHVGLGQSDDPDERFAQIRRWYDDQQDNAAYAQFQKRGTRDLEIIQRARSQGRPVILVIGGNDQGGGVIGPDPDPLRVTWFETSDKAFTLIRRLVAAKFPDALLVLRPHPSQSSQDGEFVLVARETALDDLIEGSDLCITIATTASAICLLKDKPLLTLGLSELNGQDVGVSIVDETHLLAALRQHVWSGFANPYPEGANRRFIADLFDYYLIGTDDSVPTRHHMADLARLLAGRVQRMKTGFLQDYEGREELISQAMFEDVRDRGRAAFPVDRGAFDHRHRPPISVVLPIYGDYEGTRICFDQLVRHQKENSYRVITVWDRGPDLRLRDLCMEYAQKAGFIYLENRENIGFSGTVNSGIQHAGSDDIILLNSDTVPCGDWALRLQEAAYAHPKIASVVPFSNNATIYSVPFPNGTDLPENPVDWVSQIDESAKRTAASVVEMPVAHGFCTYVRRSAFDRIGLYDEVGFGIGQGEDNDFSMRIRAAGLFVGAATGLFVGHAGSTSFGDEVMSWKLAGRAVMNGRYPCYMDEVRHFVASDPVDIARHHLKFPPAA